MSDFTNIMIGDVPYNVKDTSARSAANSAQTIAQMANNTATKANATANDNVNKITSINKRMKRCVLYIGDSYMEGAYATEYAIQKRVQTLTGIPFYTNPLSGAGFIRRSTGNKNFPALLKEWIDNNPNHLSEITDIVIAGGINDAQFDFNNVTTPNLRTSFAEIAAQCARLPVLERRYVVDMMYVNTGFTKEYLYCADLIKGVSREYGFNTADYAFTWLRNLSNVSHTDNLHPNKSGYNIIGNYIAEMLLGNTISQTEYNYLKTNGCELWLFLRDCLLHGTFYYESPTAQSTPSGTVLATLYNGIGASAGVSQFFTARGRGNQFAIEIKGNQIIAGNTLPEYGIAGNFTATAFS